MASWKSEEDFEKDLDALSDGNAYSHLPKPAPAPSKYMIKLRGKPSLFDDIEENSEEQKPECIPVRGYPVNRKEVKAPGGVPSFLNGDTRSMIREVSGLGFSNDIIEHMLKGSSPPPARRSPDVPNIAFRATNSSMNRTLYKVDDSNGSRGSSPSQSPKIKKITSSPPTCKMENRMKENILNLRNPKEFPDLR